MATLFLRCSGVKRSLSLQNDGGESPVGLFIPLRFPIAPFVILLVIRVTI